MIYNLTTPVTAARFISIPFESRKIKQAYDDGVETGKVDVKYRFEGLSPREIRMKYRELRREIRAETRKCGAKIEELNREYDNLTGVIVAWDDVKEWAAGFLTFEKPSGKSFGDFRSAIEDDVIYDMYNFKNRPSLAEYQEEVFEDAAQFIVEHNWFNAINKADEFASGSFKLPYDICIFEFMVSRKPVIAICSNYANDGAENEIVMQIAVEALNGWALSPEIYRHIGGGWDVARSGHLFSEDIYSRLVRLIGDQIRAACIALDAEVAVATLVRAAHIGHEAELHDHPEYEFYTISLAHRQRAEALRSSGEIKGVKRLHFRRGHWRHYVTFKTWVRWALVGNPELGFIDKQYRL